MGKALVRIAPLLAAVSILMGGAAVAQEYPEPSQSVSIQGDVATVEGSGCESGRVVTWTLHRGSTSNSPVVDSGSTQADQSGEYQFSIDLSGKQGRHTVRTQCGDLVQETSFNVNGAGSGRGGPPEQRVGGGARGSAADGSDGTVSGTGAQAFTGNSDYVAPLTSARSAVTGDDMLGLAIRGAALLAVAALLVLYRRRRRAPLAEA